MDRYGTRIDDGTLYIDADEAALEIGSMDDVCDVLGDTYTLHYDDEAQAAGWLQTDDDGTITFDVRETIADMDFDETFVEKMAAEPFDRTTPEGYPVRTKAFADLMAEIWDSKGNVEIE
jgi:hypothetical protein